MKTLFLSLALLLCVPALGFALANPASVQCMQDGGEIPLSAGICTLPSGLQCEQWAYHQGKCGGGIFLDVKDSIFSEDIHFVKEAGIVSGYFDGTYRPNAPINRAEFTKIIIASLFSAETIQSCDVSSSLFSDVSADDWFAPFVCVAKKEGIINGYANGTFQAGNAITFPESMKIILMGFKKPVDSPACFVADDFTNGISQKRCEEWYMPYLLKGSEMFSAKIPALSNLNLLKSSFANYTISRGEMAYFIATLKNAKPETSSSENSVETSSPLSEIPTTCTVWYDGCNTCTAKNGVLGGCTKMFCARAEEPYCKQYAELSPELMITPSYDNVPQGCTAWFDGCNHCTILNGQAMACTMKACFSPDGKPTEKPRCTSYLK